MKPRYLHDCEKCMFMGYDGSADMYVCRSSMGLSIIARHGDEAGDYASALAHILLTRSSESDPLITLAKVLLHEGIIATHINEALLAERAEMFSEGPERICSVCDEIQFNGHSGATCRNGHDGASAKQY